MAYESVDRLQKLLASEVFHYTADAKKAAGRALGTLVEIITFYLLKSWGFHHSIAIEKSLPEYGNLDITHNVEFSLHPVSNTETITISRDVLPLTASRILNLTELGGKGFQPGKTILLTKDGILRNACTIALSDREQLIVVFEQNSNVKATVVKQFSKPYAIFECKRVGVEEGMRKGPQTIEKAKQGAYVARTLSSLQKIRTQGGELYGLISKHGSIVYIKKYTELLEEIINSNKAIFLSDFILTVGVVSNHGNWFTSENHNKELKVLAQSYDWLLFLSDKGLSEFITELLLRPLNLLQPARDAFLASYTEKKTKNRFTKVQMDVKADGVLLSYFAQNKRRIHEWFNVITPHKSSITHLQSQLTKLREKNWYKIHSLK